MVLKGHRSIVNQVRFNPANHLIISSGVEKIIKVTCFIYYIPKYLKKKSGTYDELRCKQCQELTCI